LSAELIAQSCPRCEVDQRLRVESGHDARPTISDRLHASG
jgi:hypothetical protein